MSFYGVRAMVFNATFNNISVISWQSVLLVEDTEYLEKTTDLPQVTDKLYHIMLYSNSQLLVVMGIDCMCSCKFNYQTITATTAPSFYVTSNDTSLVFLSIKNGQNQERKYGDSWQIFNFLANHKCFKCIVFMFFFTLWIFSDKTVILFA